jgi:ribosomal protein S18 acetylase RimI-like enzyme
MDTISDDLVEKILEHLEASSSGNTVVIKKSSSRLFDAMAVSRGWKLEERSLHFLTSLQGREDLHADGDIQAFPIDKLDSDLFQKFFKKLNSDQSILEVKERFEDYENSSLQVFCQNDQFLAAGVLGFSNDTVVMDVIGVVPEFRNQGIGSRLHQHMMWVGQNLGDSYVGMTDAKNVAMLNIFRRNCCVEQDEQVNLCFK